MSAPCPHDSPSSKTPLGQLHDENQSCTFIARRRTETSCPRDHHVYTQGPLHPMPVHLQAASAAVLLALEMC